MPTASPRLVLPAGATALALTLAAVLMAFGGWAPGPSWVNVDNLSIALSVTAAACCVLAGVRGRGRLRLTWWLLGSMVGLYAGGDILWLAFANAAGSPPILSLADSLYLAALVPGVLGLVLYPVTRGLKSALGPVLLDAALLATSAVLGSQVFVFREVVTGAESGSEAFILLVYPVTDLMLASLVLILLVRSVGEPRLDVVMLGLTFLAYAVADNAYALSVVRGTDYTQGVAGVAYVAAPALLALGAVASTSFGTESRSLPRRLPGIWAVVLPDLAALAALAISVVWWLEDSVAGLLAATVLVLTGVRQLATTNRAHRWRFELERRVQERTEEVSAVTERQRELEAMKYAFLSAVSHELRTPLTAIRGSLELLEDGDGGELSPHAQRVVAVAARGTQRLSRLVDDIIDLERFKTGRFSVRPAVEDLADLLSDVVESLEPVAAARDIELTTVHVEAEVWCDRDRVAQALVNLVGNALKFAPPRTRVDVVARAVADQVEISVTDRGRGIPADQVPLVFDRFHQVEPLGDQAKGGAGLGLTITRHIVEAHGGRIWVQSAAGQGTTFTFTLPVAG